MKNRAGVGPVQSLAVETALLVLPAVAYLAWLDATGRGTFAREGSGQAALLAAGGIATAVPLMLFGAAANRLPLTTLGVLQYIGPTMHFFIGVAINDEPMPPTRLVGFVLVWIALAVFTADLVRASGGPRMRRRQARGEPEAVPV